MPGQRFFRCRNLSCPGASDSRSGYEEKENAMKTLLNIMLVAALSLGWSAGSFAAEKEKSVLQKTEETAKNSAKKTADATTSAAEKVTGEGRPIPMYTRADAIDAKGKTFTFNKKDGTAVKHVVTDETEIRNGEAAAKLSDVKVGDYVSGTRRKVSDTEYAVVKITKFGPKAEKKAE